MLSPPISYHTLMHILNHRLRSFLMYTAGPLSKRALIVGFRDNTAVARMPITGRQTWEHALEVRWLIVDWGKGGLDEMGEGAGDCGTIGEVVGSEGGVRKQEL